MRYTVVWYEAGSRKRKVFDHLDEAKTAAGEIGVKLANGQQAALALSAADNESYVLAVKALEPLGIPLHAAVEEYVAARKLIGDRGALLDAAREFAERHNEKFRKVTVAEAIEAMIVAKKGERLDGGYVTQMYNFLMKFAGAFNVTVQDLKAKEIQKWLRGLGGEPKTQNNRRAHLVTMANYARDFLNALPTGPTEFEKVPKMQEPDEEVEILSIEGMETLLRAAVAEENEEALLWLTLGGFGGLRPKSEALRLSWETVDCVRGYIGVRSDNKTKTKRRVPMAENLKAWLAPFANRVGKVFTHNADERTRYFALKRGVNIPFDGLRHSFGTFRMGQTADLARVSTEMGNSPEVVRKDYDKVVTAEEGNAWFAIMPRSANVVALAMEGAA